MKKIFIMFLISMTFVSADIWEKTNGPFDDILFKRLFEIEGKVFAKSSSHRTNGIIYKLENEEWIAVEEHFFNEIGSINDIEVEDNLIVIASDEGAFVSKDYGNTWDEITNYKDYYRLNSFFINNSRLFAMQHITATFNNLMISDDFGKTWEYATYGEERNDTIKARTFASNDDYLFISQTEMYNPNVVGGYQEKLLFVSENNGNAWTIRELDFNLAYMTTVADVLIGSTNNHEIVRSTDNGMTWEKYPKNYQINFFKKIDGVVYAGVSNGVIISSDTGNTWVENIIIEGGAIEDIIINDEIIYVNNNSKGIFKSTNGGDIWRKADILTSNNLVRQLKNNKDTIFASGGKKGIQFSTDQGESWHILSEKLDSLSYEILYFNKKESAFVGVLDMYTGDILISSDNLETWKEIDIYEEIKHITGKQLIKSQIVITDEEKIFLNTKDGIQVTNDYGESWNFLKNIPLDSLDDISDLIMYNGNIYVSSITKGTFVSNDFGDNWEQFIELGSDTLLENARSYKLYFHKDRLFISLFIVNDYWGIIASNDNGKSWKQIYASDKRLKDFLILENNILVTTRSKVLLSKDYGGTWEDITLNLEENFVDETYFLSQVVYKGGEIFITTKDGVYKTSLSKLNIVLNVESESEIKPYLYTDKPYPIPAGNSVTAEIYWGSNFNMEKADIGVYDIKGNRIEGDENININSHSNWPGRLTWDCSQVSDGIYFIVIEYGQSSKSIPVLKNSRR